jgi:uncharacterized protein (DUF433 family)
MSNAELFSPAQIGAVAGVPVKAVYKTMEQRLPPGFVIRRNGQPLLTRWGAICVVIDHEIPKDVPVAVRKQVYAEVKRSPRSKAIESGHGIVRYVVDVRSAANKTNARLAQYRKAMRLVVEDPAIQAGAATFKGTRILVHHIAALIAQGATEAELREDYPRLTREMIAAAPIYARSHPRRGRPRKPTWRKDRQRSRRPHKRRFV